MPLPRCLSLKTARWEPWKLRASVPAWKNAEVIEINGSKGSVVFNLERFNELQVFWKGEQPKEAQGFHDVLVSEPFHPFWGELVAAGAHDRLGAYLYPRDHPPAGCDRERQRKSPLYGADFTDGYRNAVICDTILKSAATGKQIAIKY